MNDRERIGSRIIQLRNERGISQVQLAEKTGLRQQNISRIESGKYSTGLDILAKIAEALNCRIDFV
jgi:transcriptional regulator with XRE-family HTH domain